MKEGGKRETGETFPIPYRIFPTSGLTPCGLAEMVQLPLNFLNF